MEACRGDFSGEVLSTGHCKGDHLLSNFVAGCYQNLSVVLGCRYLSISAQRSRCYCLQIAAGMMFQSAHYYFY